MTKFSFNPKLPLGRICLDLLLPSCFLTALVRLPASALPFHLDVARYAFDETSAHLLNNLTKSVWGSNDLKIPFRNAVFFMDLRLRLNKKTLRF